MIPFDELLVAAKGEIGESIKSYDRGDLEDAEHGIGNAMQMLEEAWEELRDRTEER